MKKIIPFIIFLAFFSIHHQAHSQAAILALLFGDKVASERFNISMEIGGSLATYSNLDNVERPRMGINFGIAGNIKLSENLFLSQHAYFLARRSMQIDPFSLNTGEAQIDDQFKEVSGQLNLNYIDLPLILAYQTNNKKFRFGLGPQLSILQNATGIYEGANGNFHQDVTSSLTALDYGIMTDFAYILGKAHEGKGIHIHARYYYGLPDAIKKSISASENQISFFSIHISLPFITEELAQKNLEEY